ncbi:MAG: hypothetical protein KatS3mg031_0639 [Chitinophagales bacterium]|nr:MAG: hypothetical protein KatS3mg031_0639 [Chitinophagales bacterium]
MATKKSTSHSEKKSQAAEALKKLFYAGLGLAEEVSEKVQQRYDALAKKGKVHEKEIQKTLNDIRKSAQSKRAELEKKFSRLIKENEFIKSKEFQSLLKRLEKAKEQPQAKQKTKPASGTSSKAKAKPKTTASAGRKKSPAKKVTQPGPTPAVSPADNPITG